MDIVSAPAAQVEKRSSPGFLHDLAWFFSGAVLPMGSLSFYRQAARRRVGVALLFFFILTIFITLLTTLNVAVSMSTLVKDIHAAYQQGKIPSITISNGIAQVQGPQPAIFLDDVTSNGAMLIAVDTTGQITEIDQSRYTQGILLTRTELHLLNPGQPYQRLPLSELNAAFGTDPLVINEQTVSTAWVTFSAILTVLVFIALVLWNSVVRLMFIAMLALILWGIGTLLRPQIGYGPFIITGLYAIVPAIYISYLLSRSQVSFPGLQTILLLVFWAAGLVGALSNEKFFAMDLPPRLWTALLGVPMLLWLVIDVFVKLPSPAGPIILWAVVILTGTALVAVRLFFHLTAMQSAPPVLPTAPPQSPTPPQPSA